jgi:hypothetical protein
MAVSRIRRSNTTSIKVGERTPVTTVSTGTLIRSMQQINTGRDTPLYYEFHFGISTFTHDSSGVLYTEIPRPLNMPLVDATSQKLERCSFEFLIAVPYDSLGSSIDSHITLLQDFANEARPVQFSNVHSALGSRTWNIDSITFQVTRVNESGKATAVTCNMSLVESIARTERFIQLPKFTYAIPKGTTLSEKSGTGDATGNNGNGNIGGVIKIQGLGNGNVVITTAANHGLANGTSVKIAMSPALSTFIRNLYDPSAVYEIRVSASTPTKFSYTEIGGGVVAETSLTTGQIQYTVTSAKPAGPWVPIVPSSSYQNKAYVAPKTKPKEEIESKLDATGFTPTGPNGDFILEQVIKPYLYGLKLKNADLYNKNIGDTSSVSYQKAVAYLVKISEQGGSPTYITLDEIVRNI